VGSAHIRQPERGGEGGSAFAKYFCASASSGTGTVKSGGKKRNGNIQEMGRSNVEWTTQKGGGKEMDYS